MLLHREQWREEKKVKGENTKVGKMTYKCQSGLEPGKRYV